MFGDRTQKLGDDVPEGEIGAGGVTSAEDVCRYDATRAVRTLQPTVATQFTASK